MINKGQSLVKALLSDHSLGLPWPLSAKRRLKQTEYDEPYSPNTLTALPSLFVTGYLPSAVLSSSSGTVSDIRPLRYQRVWGFGLAITIVHSGNNYFHYHSAMTVSLVWACYPLAESNLWDGCLESPLLAFVSIILPQYVPSVDAARV